MIGYDKAEDRFTITFPYDRSLVDQVKVIGGRRWEPTTKEWSAPSARWAEVSMFAANAHLEMSPAAAARVGALRDLLRTDPDAAAEYQITVGTGTTIELSGGYQTDIVDRARGIAGRRWEKKRKVWIFPASQAQVIRDLIGDFALTVNPAAMAALDLWAANAEEMLEASSAETADLDLPGPLSAMYPYQKAAVLYAEKAGWRTFLADQPGLGKTAEALACLEVADAYPAVIVVPSIVETNWRREIERWIPHRSVASCRGQKPGMVAADIAVVGYPVVSYWAPTLLERGIRGLVLDEAHFAKSPKAQRTQAAKALAGVGYATKDPVTKKAVRHPSLPGSVPSDGVVLCLTGTPVMNEPGELVAQLQILGRLQDFGGWKGFTSRYKAAGPHVLTELNERLRSTCMIRRRKEDVLPELPAKQRFTLPLDPDPKVMVDYRKAEADLLEYLAARARALALESGLDPDSAAVMAKMRAAGAEHLVRIGVLRRLAARAKVPAVIEWTRSWKAGSEDPLTIFAHHREVVEDLSKALGFETIQGGDSHQERQRVVDEYQAGLIPGVVLSIQAAGVGLTLTRSSTCLFVEQAWNPATLIQAEDRHHRIGQAESVTCWYSLAAGTIDEDMLDLIERKRLTVDAITDGEVNDGDWSASVAGDLIERLTRRALGASDDV